MGTHRVFFVGNEEIPCLIIDVVDPTPFLLVFLFLLRREVVLDEHERTNLLHRLTLAKHQTKFGTDNITKRFDHEVIGDDGIFDQNLGVIADDVLKERLISLINKFIYVIVGKRLLESIGFLTLMLNQVLNDVLHGTDLYLKLGGAAIL